MPGKRLLRVWRRECKELKVHTEWRLPISGVFPIIMENSALAGDGGGCTPTPFHSSYHNVQSCLRSQRGQIHPLYFISTLYVLCGIKECNVDNKIMCMMSCRRAINGLNLHRHMHAEQFLIYIDPF